MYNINDFDPSYISTHTAQENLEHYGLSRPTFDKICKRLNVKPIRTNLQGEIAKLIGTMTDTDIAKTLGCNTHTVSHYRETHGIPRYKIPYRGKYTVEYLRELHDTYGSWKKASEAVGVSKQCLSEVANKLGLSYDKETYITKERVAELMDEYGSFAKASKSINMSKSCFRDWFYVYFGKS